ncbi:integrin alpha-L-like [Discoglossus pictus]
MRLLMCSLLLALSFLKELDVLLCMNLAVSPERNFLFPASSLFGYRVRQFTTDQGERVIVGAPGSGNLYTCDVTNGSCDIITLSNSSHSPNLGLTLEVDPTSAQLIVCGPSPPHDCHETPYMNGICYTLSSSLSMIEELTPGYQSCQQAEVDICFLFDGSSSTGKPELEAIKEFMRSAMESQQNSSVHFAAVQFSHELRIEFNFSHYQQVRDPNILLRDITILGGLTHTYKAIKFTLDNVFTQNAGSRPKAKKVLLMLTDGEANDADINRVIESAEKKRVIRYIIGMGYNFHRLDLQKYLDSLASYPPIEHTRVLEDISGLRDLFTKLKEKILSLEGVVQDSESTLEFSSAGFSAALSQDGLVLGDPGVYQGSGGFLDVLKENLLVNMSHGEAGTYGYLGYAIRLLQTAKGLFCVVGAPRFEYRGLVILLQERMDKTNWKETHRLYGEQVGSYFGSEINVADMDQDGFADLVFVSAPHYQEEQRFGRVSVCLVSEGVLNCSTSLRGEPGHFLAQFGAAVSTLGDLDGDGLSEVAVGAPYETAGRGAIYIFKGRIDGVHKTYIQRLVGPPKGQGFGVSIHGVLDMTKDGLPDIAVGSWGHVAVHRSQPLVTVTLNMTFDPPEIPIPNLESTVCENEVTMQACVYPKNLTPLYKGPLDISLSYSFILDLGHHTSRVSFKNQQREAKEMFPVQWEGRECQNFSVILSDCSLEDVSPVRVSLNVSLGPNVSQWLLSPSRSISAVSEVPFQICGSGGVCGPDLRVNFQGDTVLVAQHGSSFHLLLELQNMGEDGHLVTMNITYPAGLTFRRASISKQSRRITVNCKELEPGNLICNVSHPIFRQRAWAVIQITFDVSTNVSWAESVQIEASATSANKRNESVSNNMAAQSFVVLYPINVIARGLDTSIKFANFSSHEDHSVLHHSYQIRNLLQNALPPEVTITVVTPRSLSEGLEWDLKHIKLYPSGSCVPVDGGQTHGPHAKTFLCAVQSLNLTLLRLEGTLRCTRMWKKPVSVSVGSSVTINYNESRYHGEKMGAFHTAQVITQVELLVLPNHTMYLIGGSVGGLILLLLICGLLYKCGFFKRYKDRVGEEQPPNNGPVTDGEETATQEPLTSQLGD